MTTTFKKSLRLVSATILLAASFPSWADWVVVASAKSSIGKQSAEDISNLYLGKVSELPGAGAITAFNLPEGNGVRDDFFNDTAKKAPAALKAYWSRMIFTGQGQPPKSLADSAEVKRMLNGNPKAVGYIEKSAVDATVKVILSP